jgi:eukaryotic-like serine/threonine-protein kinase
MASEFGEKLSFRERLEWLIRMGLLVFVLAAAAFLSAVMAMRFAIHGREVEMPNLVGKNSAEALALLHKRGLQLKVVDRVYDNLPLNAVVRQSPPAGEHMKVSQDVHVVLSLGPQNVTIPEVVGESVRVARIELLESGLQVGEVTSYSAPAALGDTILQQDPTSGTRAESPRVDLLVAQEDQQSAYVMPWLVGMPLLEADHLISSGEMKIAQTTFSPSNQWPKGTVISQTPEQGSKITHDSTINVVVAQ